MKERTLVTGATGFIGKHVVQYLISLGYPLTLLVRDKQKAARIWHSEAGLCIANVNDLNDDAESDLIWDEIANVVHFAGLAHLPKAGGESAKAFFAANVGLTQVLADQAAARGINRFVFLSSLAAITHNSSEKFIDDNTDNTADSLYGLSKKLAEEYVEKLLFSQCLTVSIRPPLVVGWDARGNWELLQKIAATGLPLPFSTVKAARQYVSITTMCEAIACVLETSADPSLSGHYCLCDSEPLTLPEVVTELRAGMGRKPRLLPFPTSLITFAGKAVGRSNQVAGLLGNLPVDSSRFNTRFGFQPSTGIREGIRQSGQKFAAEKKN